MKSILLICLLALTLACSKDKDPGFTSAEGKWKYATSDGKVAVTFDLVKTSTGSLDIANPTIKIDGTLYNAEKQISGVSLPVIGSMRINANDSKAVYPYNIIFNNGVVSNDFTKIEVPTGSYTFPWPAVKALSAIVIERQ